MRLKGFTLIELLIVILIIGILATVAVPFSRDAIMKAKVSEIFSLVRQIEITYNFLILEKGYAAAFSPPHANYP